MRGIWQDEGPAKHGPPEVEVSESFQPLRHAIVKFALALCGYVVHARAGRELGAVPA